MEKLKNKALNHWVVFFVLFLNLSINAQVNTFDKILNDFEGNKKVLVAAHRAAHSKHPENSIAAIKESIRIGVHIIEMDVRQTEDGELILMHDRTIDRTSNGIGEVQNLKWTDIKGFNLKHESQLTSEKIPTFEEALILCKDKILIDIDFKEDDIEAVQKAYALIKKYEVQDQVMFYLYDYRYIPLLQQINPNVKIMPRARNEIDIKNIYNYDAIKIIHIDDSFYNAKLMKKMIRKGYRVWINSLGKFDKIEKEQKNKGFDELFKMKYINVIQTDLPEELLNYIKERNM